MTINTGFSQNNSDVNSLEREEVMKLDSANYALEKKNFCEALANDSVVKIKSPWNYYTFKVLNCKGNRGSQEVELIIIATQSHLNQKTSLELFRSSVIDGLGKELKLKKGYFGPQTIFTDTPVQLTLTIQGVMPGTEKIGHLGLRMSSKDITESGGFDFKTLELRNILINW